MQSVPTKPAEPEPTEDTQEQEIFQETFELVNRPELPLHFPEQQLSDLEFTILERFSRVTQFYRGLSGVFLYAPACIFIGVY